MLRSGILNPHVLELLARVRHTNTLVIADRGFPFWPQIETVDISLTDDIPTVLDVVSLLRESFVIGRVLQAKEFHTMNTAATREKFAEALRGLSVETIPHESLKQHVPKTIGLIRTGDTTQYANLIVESA